MNEPALEGPPLRLFTTLWAVTLGLILAFAIAAAPPAVKPESAPANEFSAARALTLVRGLTATGLPHPVGSPDHDRARDFVLGEVKKLGLTPRVQKGSSCGRKGCAEVENIIAVIEGREPGPALMLAAHYDSVPGGPGASDDGAGIATILETARALLAAGKPRRSVILLLDDGEELATLGAKLFVANDPAARDVGVVLNFEARGTAGQTVMFETSDNAAWLLGVYAHEVSRPMAQSVIYPAYKRLPNDTDLTVFKAAGMQGMNFAFADRFWDYHSASDTADRMDPRSLQHMGDQGLGVARALVDRDLSFREAEDAIYFDLFSTTMITYRARWAFPLAVIGMLCAAGAIGLSMRKRATSVGAMLRGALAPLAMVLVAVAAGGTVNLILGAARGAHAPKGMNPLVPWIAYVGLSAAAAMLTGLALAPRQKADKIEKDAPADVFGAALGSLVVWTLLSLLVARTVTGASYLFTLPALIASLAAIVAALAPAPLAHERAAWASTAALFAAALFWFPVLRILLVMVGASVSPAATLPVALVVSTALPALSLLPGKLRLATPIAAGAVGLLAMIATFAGVGL
ncbi:MAG: M20/M25/M40 family metallo-hydrolase [Byssovorax sp.]